MVAGVVVVVVVVVVVGPIGSRCPAPPPDLDLFIENMPVVTR